MAKPGAALAMLVLLILAFGGQASAHNLNSGYSYVRITGNQVEYELLLPHPILLQYDENGDRNITGDELDRQKQSIRDYMMSRLQLINDGQPMEGELVRLESAIQPATEDRIVRFVFRYASESIVEGLTIRYDVIIDGVDPGHQNYIQLYREGVLVGHRVVEKGNETFEYVPDAPPRFRPSLLLDYAVLGVQRALKSPAAWLAVVCAAIAARRLKSSLELAAAFGAANTVGYFIADRSGLSLPYAGTTAVVVWAVLLLTVQRLRRGSLPNAAFAAFAATGALFGLSSYTSVVEVGLFKELKAVSLVLFGAGFFAGIAGLLYLLYMLPESVRSKLPR